MVRQACWAIVPLQTFYENEPDAIDEIELALDNPQLRYKEEHGVWAAGLLVASGLAASNSEAVRLIEQGGTAFDEQRVAGRDAYIGVRDSVLIRRGKRQFVRVRFTAGV